MQAHTLQHVRHTKFSHFLEWISGNLFWGLKIKPKGFVSIPQLTKWKPITTQDLSHFCHKYTLVLGWLIVFSRFFIKLNGCKLTDTKLEFTLLHMLSRKSCLYIECHFSWFDMEPNVKGSWCGLLQENCFWLNKCVQTIDAANSGSQAWSPPPWPACSPQSTHPPHQKSNHSFLLASS